MTTELGTWSGAASVPVLPGELAYTLARYTAGEAMNLADLPEAMVAAALKALPAARLCCAPSTPAHIQSWMEVVAISVGMHAPEPLQRNARIALVMETCGDLPAGCWTPASRVHFARERGARAAWFPTDGEIDAVLRPFAWRLRRTLKVLESVVEEGSRRRAPPPPPPLSEEEIPINQLAGEARDRALAHVRVLVQGWMRSRVPEIVAVAERSRSSDRARPACLSGRPLWESRNRALCSNGFPPLPEPTTFDGYGSGA